MKAVADTLGVARSHLHDRLRRPTAARGAYGKAEDEVLLTSHSRTGRCPPDLRLSAHHGAAESPAGGGGQAVANHKRVFRIMRREGLLLTPHTGRRRGRVHDGKVVVMRSNLRWCSDAFEVTCWNGEIVRVVFAIDAHDREILAWHAITGGGISGSMVRDLMLEAVESRFGAIRAPQPVEWLSDNGSPYTAGETVAFANALGLVPCFTPVASPESNGIAEAFVKTFKRDYVRVNPLPDAASLLRQIAGWFLDYNENHPHSGLKMRSPREFIRAQTQ
ncbi:MAG: IS3 family transposase [Alphaproteobacteria bacterium]